MTMIYEGNQHSNALARINVMQHDAPHATSHLAPKSTKTPVH